MRLVFLTAFTMVAFASNSILTRMAIEPGHIDPISFALIRVLAGAVFLCGLAWVQGSHLVWRGPARLIGAASLSVYMIGFSLAYVSLDAGLGALILFGVVQISMFAYSACVGAYPTHRQMAGAAIAFAGLVVALWPDADAAGNAFGAIAMVIAGLGWAAYTLSGKSARNPLGETAANFALCLPILCVLTFPFIDVATGVGVFLAVICGALTSGLGYALWYKVLPDMPRSSAAVVQLSVPVIAILAGVVVLNESITVSIIAASALVVLGIWLAVTRQSAPADRS